MMIEQQRQQLAMMGIDLWIPRHAAVRSISTATTLWRDADIGQSGQLSTASKRSELESAIILKKEIKKEIVIKPDDQHVSVNVKAVETPLNIQETAHAAAVTKIDVEPLEIEQQAFQLQVLFAEQFVLLVDQQQLTAQTLPLWRNIQQALHLQDASLQWPFPLVNLQEPSGLQDYLQGFFDVVAAEKSIFCLGELPVSFKLSCQTVPSLPDMLQHPLLKQQLWKLIQHLRP
ncbi:hypothetical protein E0H86_03445 [Acinetobacter sp. ANC 4635]|uniref:hypothetical protein n=1 Tax=Acinetobacter sp. ANC 4635 TaxID=2529846 RepID=UPI00103AA88B|nr:hypothetical protein [Acinetobacter sp. ANC 4635]TCB32523.1 hypothetical protein E0H86_03445 [Acinetobacter sp. ANC 4635]